MGIVLTRGQLFDHVLRRARQIEESGARDLYFAALADSLRDIDPPIPDHTARAAAIAAFIPFNSARTPRAKTQ